MATQHQRYQAAASRIAEEIGDLLDALAGGEPELAARFASVESRARSTLPLSVAALSRAIRFVAEARVAASGNAPERARQLLLVAQGLTSDFAAAARDGGASGGRPA